MLSDLLNYNRVMSIKRIFLDFLQTGNTRISISLGECLLEAIPLGEGEGSFVFKASLNGTDVALKFFLFEGTVFDRTEWLNKFKRDFISISLLETKRNIIPYVDYDVLRIQELEIPILIMKLYKCSLEEYRYHLSADIFLRLFRVLTHTMQYLHSKGVNHYAIKPRNILIDDQNDFILTDIAFTPSAVSSPVSDVVAIGEVLRWYAFGNNATDTAISKVFPSLKLYDRVVERCLATDDRLRFCSIDEIVSFTNLQGDSDPKELMHEFSLICRKNFPKELPEFVHCTDQKKIAKLFADFVARKDLFDGKLVYFTDEEKNMFSPVIGKEGYIKFDHSAEFRVLDIWIHSDSDPQNDYILVHHANTLPEKVNGKNVYRWAVYEKRMFITWEEAMNGFAEIEGDILPLEQTKIEYFNRIPREGYVFIALNQMHKIIDPLNKVTLRDYFFRFSFSYVNRYILEDMNQQAKLQVKSCRKR